MFSIINRFDDALRHINRSVELNQGELNRAEQTNCLLTRSFILRAAGRDADGLEDLLRAFESTRDDETPVRARAASAAMRFFPVEPRGRAFVDNCQELLLRLLCDASFHRFRNQAMTAVISVGQRFLKLGKVSEAEQLLTPFLAQFDPNSDELPWEMYFLKGSLQYSRGHLDRCWADFVKGLDKLNARVPAGEDVTFSLTWLLDKEEYQTTLATFALQLADLGVIGAQELLKIFEFMNGREIQARLMTRSAALSSDERCCERLRARTSNAFSLLKPRTKSDWSIFLARIEPFV